MAWKNGAVSASTAMRTPHQKIIMTSIGTTALPKPLNTAAMMWEKLTRKKNRVQTRARATPKATVSGVLSNKAMSCGAKM